LYNLLHLSSIIFWVLKALYMEGGPP